MIATQTIAVDRTEDFTPVKANLAYIVMGPKRRPTLGIFTVWRAKRGDWGVKASYTVEEFTSQLGGRAFHLIRDEDDVQRDPSGGTHYSVLIDDKGHDMCDCRGFHSAQKRNQFCKHVYTLRHLIETGRLPPTETTR